MDATALAERMLGDTIYSNMLVLGAAWQAGAVPLSGEAIRRAIELNGAKVPENLRAFEVGRWAVAQPDAAQGKLSAVDTPLSMDEKIAFRAAHLVAYQGRRVAKRYQGMLTKADGAVQAAMAEGYHKLLAYKDEYEVARLLKDSEAKAAEAFEGDFTLKYHLSPPVMAKTGPDGRPTTREYGAWMARMFPMLARMKRLRGTWFDPFGRSDERRMERALITEYERDMTEVLPLVTDQTRDAVVALARLPMDIRGFGPVKMANAAKAAKRREELLAVIRAGGEDVAQAEQ
jgi:indolepyruvate ferredoxin oxidoreductase